MLHILKELKYLLLLVTNIEASISDLLGVWIFLSNVGDTHEVGGFWTILETWQFGILRILGLQHYLCIKLFNHR